MSESKASKAAADGGKDAPNYQHFQTLTGHVRSVSTLKFSPSGTMLASGCTLCLVYFFRQSSPFVCWTQLPTSQFVCGA
jgi:WD40 repeat protein